MDTSPNTAPPPASSNAPSWTANLLDVLRARERMWYVAAILLILLGALLALLAPGTLPPTLVVGAAVGVAAVLLATALVLGLDASDLIVRGPRHVAAAGGVVAGHISRSTSDIQALVGLIDAHAAEGGRVRVALTPASRSAGVPGARANIVAAELAARGDKVLVTDLTRGGTPAVGLSDVIAGDRKLADAVRFDDELYLAHLAVGSEPELALEGFAGWAQGLPPDLDVLVAALPPLSEPGVLPAVQGVELVLLLVEVDRTERVDLIASLDAIDAAGVPAELVLVDATTAAVRDSASPTVEVLSTPGSAPRQQDPTAFELHDRDTGPDDGGSGVRTVPAPAGPPTEAAPTPDPEPVDDLDDLDGDQGVRTVAAPPTSPDATSPDATSPDPSGPDPSSPDPSAADTGDLPEPAIADRDDDEPVDFDDDYELDDRPVMEPGGGHVRTMHRRGAASDETMAMPPVGTGEPVGPVAPGSDEPDGPEPTQQLAPEPSAGQEPSAPEPDRTTFEREPEPVADPRAGATWPEPDPAPEPESPSTFARDPEPTFARDPEPTFARDPEPTFARDPEPEPDAGPEPDPEPEAEEPVQVSDSADADEDDDEDPIDLVAREQARLSASLQQLADDVWSRGDD